MPRKRPSPPFKKTDAARALKAAQAAGIKARIEIDIPGKKITIVPIGEPSKDGIESPEPTPLEQWRTKRSGQG